MQEWLEEMAACVKSMDGNHLVTTGLEGFYSSVVFPGSVEQESSNPGSFATQYGVDFIRNHQVSGIDFASVHSYPDNWYCAPQLTHFFFLIEFFHRIPKSVVIYQQPYSTLSKKARRVCLTERTGYRMPSMTETEKQEFMSTWIQTHINDGAATLKKPVLFAEFGKFKSVAGYTESVRFAAMSAMFDAIYNSAVDGGAGAGALVWQLLTNTTTSLADGFEIILSSEPDIASLMQKQSSRLSSLS